MRELKDYSHLPMRAQWMVAEIFQEVKAEIERERMTPEEVVGALEVLIKTWQ